MKVDYGLLSLEINMPATVTASELIDKIKEVESEHPDVRFFTTGVNFYFSYNGEQG